MQIAVIGTGYVGLTTAVALALAGHTVTGIDADPEKVAKLSRGQVPIYEPGLEESLRQAADVGAIRFTTQPNESSHADVVFICVGTPMSADGTADLTYVFTAVEQLRAALPVREQARVIAMKSTVPVGTTDRVAQRFADRPEIHVVSNPEFLREGTALFDSLHPARIVIGSASAEGYDVMQRVYETIRAPRLLTTRVNAELIKYASNAFLATRISFMNELARLCDAVGADVTQVAAGMGYDSRIGAEFLRAGLGYGGSCFPKDTAALLRVAAEHAVDLSIIRQATRVNDSQPAWFWQNVREALQPLAGKRIALLGLAFKPDTDDIREAPALKLIPQLLRDGAVISACDPAAVPHVKRLYPSLDFAETPYEALQGADAALLVTEWQPYVQLDWERVKQAMARPLLFDGRNAWPRDELIAWGFSYSGVGRA